MKLIFERTVPWNLSMMGGLAGKYVPSTVKDGAKMVAVRVDTKPAEAVL